MSLNLALDSGGTKVAAILYDERFQPISTATVGSMRSCTTSEELVEQNIRELISKLKLQGKTISNIVGYPTSSLLEALQSVSVVENVHTYREGLIGLFAANIYGDGCSVISGTGSSLYGKLGEKEFGSGGYGTLIFDEGSGYWIAREGFAAAIKDYQQRGSETVLRELISLKINPKLKDFHKVLMSVCNLPNDSYAAYVASFAPLVTEAAYKGDAVAQDILTRAGRSLGEQLVFFSNQYNLPKDLPIAIQGSAWKGHNITLAEFTETIRNSGITGKICFPVFEPVVGAILCHYHKAMKNIETSDMEKFSEMYKEYRIPQKRR